MPNRLNVLSSATALVSLARYVARLLPHADKDSSMQEWLNEFGALMIEY
jgi:hypothetical protein